MVAGRLPKHIDQSHAYGHPLPAFDETIKEERRSQEILQPKLWNTYTVIWTEHSSTDRNSDLFAWQIKCRKRFLYSISICDFSSFESVRFRARCLAFHRITNILWRPLWDTSHGASHTAGIRVLGTSAGKVIIISPFQLRYLWSETAAEHNSNTTKFISSRCFNKLLYLSLQRAPSCCGGKLNVKHPSPTRP